MNEDRQRHDDRLMHSTSSKDGGGPSKEEKDRGILSSQFFVPSIVQTFVKATLADARFPTDVVQQLMQPDDLSSHDKDGGDEACRLAAAQRAREMPLHLSSAQRNAVRAGIQALCTHLAIPPQEKHEENDAAHKRLLLGFCRLLDQQEAEAGVEFDVVRQALFAASRRRKEEKTVEERSLSMLALWGAELSAGVRERGREASRFRQWRRKECHGS